MAKNLSDLLTSIKMDLGIYALSLPFDNPDKAMLDVINLKTIPTFSTFMPDVREIAVEIPRDLIPLQEEYTESKFIIPDIFNGREILYVRKITLKSKLLGNGFISPVFDGSIDTYNALMQTQASANLASVAAPPITFKFETPNILYLYNVATAYGKLDLELALVHSDNLATINQTAWDSFYELALLDVKKFLYNILKHYTEIQTAYGTFNMKIDSWESAESDRKDWIEKARDTYHLEVEPLFII